MKTKANSRVLQVTSGLLASVLLLSALPCTAFAASGVEKSAVPNEPETADNAIALDAAVPEEALTSVELSEYTVPSGMTLEELSDQGYTERVYGAETNLYSAVLSDGKGNYTLYYYDSPIKYVDEDGVVRDKILQPMALPDGGYRTRQSDILTTFSPNLTDGIKLEREDQSIRLTPLEAEAQAALTVDSARVAYAVDVATRYEYTLTPMGFKEDIIVESYTGQTEYSFLLETNGLTLVEEYGTYHLVDEYNTVQAYLGDIILFTADERNNTFGSMTAQTVEEGQSYLLTIELDEDWLSDPDTHYPITVDPTINYSTPGNIEDVTVDSAKTYAGDSGSLYVGRNTDGAKRRALMRFPNLNLRGCTVTKATVSIRELLCEDTVRPVECREFTGNSWSESGTTTWSGVGNSAGGTLYGSYNVCYDEGVKQATRHRYEYDITALAKKWAAGTSSPSKGLVFRSTDSYETSGDKSYCAFASINRGSNPPMLTVEYTYNYSIRLDQTTIDLVEGTSVSVKATTIPAGLPVSWSVDGNTGTKVEITPSGDTCQITAKKLGSVTVIATITDPNGKQIGAGCEVYARLADGAYMLQTAGSHLFAMTNGIFKYRENKLESDIFQNTQNSSDRGQHWRLAYLGGGRYTIRSMTDSKLALYANTDGSVLLKQIGTVDSVSAVPRNAQWKIELTTSYYYSIRSVLLSGKALGTPAGDSNNGTPLCTENYVAGKSNQSWFHPIKVENPSSGMQLYYFKNTYVQIMSGGNTVSLEVGDTLQLYAAYYSAGSISQAVSWSTSNSSITIVASGKITAKNPGETNVNASYSSALCTIKIKVFRLPNPNGQNRTNWCWVASAKMVGEHNGGSGKLPTGSKPVKDKDVKNLHSFGATKFYGQNSDLSYTIDAGQLDIVMETKNEDINDGGNDDDVINALQHASFRNMTVGKGGGSDGIKDELKLGYWVAMTLKHSNGYHTIVVCSYEKSIQRYRCWDPGSDSYYYFFESDLINGTIKPSYTSDNHSFASYFYCH